MEYKYFCGCCGKKFSLNISERNVLGLLNDIVCPKCGAYDVYRDDKAGHKEEYHHSQEYENEMRLFEDETLRR